MAACTGFPRPGKPALGQSSDHRPVVALTGGIASGKTRVADHLKHLGVGVVDTDLIAREVVEPGSPGLKALVDEFGPGLLTSSGNLDRSALRARMLSDSKVRAKLNELLHPLIEQAARRQLGKLRDKPYALLVVPLLVESGLFQDADRVVVVDVPEPVQINRLMARDGLSAEQAKRTLATQATRAQRLRVADDVLDNSGSVEDLLRQVEILHQQLIERFDPTDRSA